MTVFLSTLNQMGFLFLLIIIGYVLCRAKLLPDNASAALSKLESCVFIPALVMGTFIQNFTKAKLSEAWIYLLVGIITAAVTAPLAVLLSRLCSKDAYIRKIYTYGLAFSNFGFMGNAVVKALYPDIFLEYLIFVLPFWALIYTWGVPVLLIPSESGEKRSFLSSLKSFVNPMFIAMLIGIIIGIFSIPLPDFVGSAVTTLGDCMSPIAMLLTGITIAKIDLVKTFKNLSIYVVSFIRLLALPLVALVLLIFFKLPDGVALCVICSLAMPLGLNTVVVPSAYGSDTSTAAGMALISHLLSCITIPIIFMLYSVLL